ncbi:MAG TPA: alpha/beta hydrolase [Steroidobacteraceae bacterium]|nr:alpha/beta hydrolase [Steroidobacteraceae bacterium]
MKRCCPILCAALALLAACGQSHPVTVAAAASAPPSPAVTRFTPSADGVPIGWHQYGHGDPAVVLIHGWAEDSTIWRAQVAAVAAQYTVVTLDLAGQGVSGSARRNWSLAGFAQDVAAVAAALPNSRVVLVGQGMGGPVALEAAPLIGARLLGLVGVETFRTLGEPRPLPSQVDQAVQPFRDDFAGAVRKFVSATLFRPHSDPTLVRKVADLMARSAPEPGVATLTDLNRLDYAAILPAVKVPMVVIDSDLGGAVDAGRLRHAAPHLTLITLVGDDSFAMLDDSGRFNHALLQAIASLRAQ